MSKRNTVPPALPYSANGYRDDGYAGGKQALSETRVDCKGALGTTPCTSVFLGKGHAPNSNTGSRQQCRNRERNRKNPSTPKVLVRRSRSTATIVDMPHGERRSSQRDESLTTWSSDFLPIFQKATTDLTLPPIVPCQ